MTSRDLPRPGAVQSQPRALLTSSTGARGLSPEPSPFPGLRPYGPTEAHLFFGRETHVEALLTKLSTRRFSAVVGSSGSGKSSFVLAGILPRLMRGYRANISLDSSPLEMRPSWRVARMRPGDDPIGNLAEALQVASRAVDMGEPELHASSATDDAIELALLGARLRRNQHGLVEASTSLNLDHDENLLLIVDQFEELFRFRALRRRTPDMHDPAAAFVQLLLRAVEQKHVPIFVMLTMRSEFIGECVQFSGLPEALNDGQYLLPLLNRDQREQVIRGPMAVAGAKIERALVQRLLNDAGHMTDQLPALQHALMRSFDLWQHDPHAPPELGTVHYELAGTIQDALSKHAEEALAEVQAELSSQGVRIVEKMLRALTDRGTEGHGVRRPCRVREVLAVTGSDLATLCKVVGHFSDEKRGFLSVEPSHRELSEDSLLDLSHEVLMRRWPRLSSWAAAEQAFAEQLRQLHDAAQKHARGELGLWRDPELARALSFWEREQPTAAAAARYNVDLERIQAFLQASVAARAAALSIERDARVLRRMRRMFTEARASTLLAMLSVFVLVTTVGSGLLDRVLLGSTRFKLLSVSARHLVAAPGLHESLAAVVIDGKTVLRLRNEVRHGQQVGEFGSSWRTLQAELLNKLVDAGAKTVVFDFDFPNDASSSLVSIGSQELGAAIAHARRAGTAVVIAGNTHTHPAVRAALEAAAPAGASYAAGREASACISAARDGSAVFANLLTVRSGQPSVLGLPLAGLAAFWRTPATFVDQASRQLFLAGDGGSRRLAFAGMGRQLTGTADCYPSRAGDEPALQIIDLTPRELTREYNAPRSNLGASSIVPFERVLSDSNLDPFKLAGALILVGKQYQDDRVELLGTRRWGMSLHLNALNDLLTERAIQPISPISQLAWILVLCVCVAWLRLRNRDRAPWLRWCALGGLVLGNLVVVVGCAIVLELLMDECYQILAMLVTHAIVGYLDNAGITPRANSAAAAQLRL